MGNVLKSGETLPPAGVLESATLELWMQPDGNLVVFRKADHFPLWSVGAGTAGNELRMLSNGNLAVMHPQTLAVTWDSKTGVPGAQLVLDTDLRIVVGPEVLWVLGPMTGRALPTEMNSDESLLPRDSIVSSNGHYRLDLQVDGNLVLFPHQAGQVFPIPVWSVGASPGVKIPRMGTLVLARDGDLQLLSPHPTNGTRAIYWHSNTAYDPKNFGQKQITKLRVSDDGHMVLLDAQNKTVKQFP